MSYSAKVFRKKEIIVTANEQKNIFINLSIALCIGGLLAFSAEYFPTSIHIKKNFFVALLKSLSLISLGIMLFLSQKIRKEYIKDMVTNIILLLSIPIATFQFLEYAAITVWVYPVTIIISSLLFTKRSLLIMSTVAAILTQRLIWVLKPEAYVLVDRYDYMMRILVFIVVFLLGSYVNRIYVAKIKKIEYLAYNDSLTDLPNRFSFAHKVDEAIDNPAKNNQLLSILFIDLDNFKIVNDSIGHSGGDILLRQIAKRLVKEIGKSGTVSRFGGDEFMILLEDTKDSQNIIEITEKIMKTFSGTFIVNDYEFSITASAGISIYPHDGLTSEDLIKNADIAMYKAKDKGKNQYALCSYDMKSEVETESILSADLYHALERDELIVYYQPQINLYTNEITGAEALLRWNHPKRGMISPAVFIPLAEKNGLINSIGEWVLRSACMQNKSWQDIGIFHINVSVNISIVQFLNPNIVEDIKNIIRDTGLNAKYLELEITENFAIKENISAVNILEKLKKTGVSISIDDFGTKYSSLSRLKVLPIDRIKIDKHFIDGIETQEKDRAVTMTIINLAKNLGLDVIAEGVETKEQLDFLKKNMCDHVQGYYYYKPISAEEMEEILWNLTEQSI